MNSRLDAPSSAYVILASDRDKVAHLLRRFGLGASEAEVNFYAEGGVNKAIDRLINFDQVPQGFQMDINRLRRYKNGNAVPFQPQQVQTWWYTNILCTQRPLEQKMTIFWHHHFAASAEKVESGEAMRVYVETLRQNAFGRFEDLLLSISKDPAMLYWLDNAENVKGKPNENFAREVMELFTLGVGNYTENDVKESARAFTGWRYGVVRPNGRIFPTPGAIPKRESAFMFMPLFHDDGSKTILGNTGNFNGDDVCGILAGNQTTPHFLVRKIWDWFVYPKPEDDLVDRFATAWRAKGLEVRVLLRMIMESPEFYSDKAARAIVKNPIDFSIAAMRQLGIGSIVSDMATAQDEAEKANPPPAGPGQPRYAIYGLLLKNSTKSMGMELVYPPDVSGWRTGAYWISTATMLERMKLADSIFLRGEVPVGKGKTVRQTSAYPSAALLSGVTDPAMAATKIASIFDAPMPDAKMHQLQEAANRISGGTVSNQNAHLVAAGVTKLIFGSPEFQFC